jgi:hypothetical protein
LAVERPLFLCPRSGKDAELAGGVFVWPHLLTEKGKMADEFLYLKGQKSASDVKTVEYLRYYFFALALYSIYKPV